MALFSILFFFLPLMVSSLCIHSMFLDLLSIKLCELSVADSKTRIISQGHYPFFFILDIMLMVLCSFFYPFLFSLISFGPAPKQSSDQSMTWAEYGLMHGAGTKRMAATSNQNHCIAQRRFPYNYECLFTAHKMSAKMKTEKKIRLRLY